jgi:hypothetical protein
MAVTQVRRLTVGYAVSSSDLVNNRVDAERRSLEGAFRARDALKAQKLKEAAERERAKSRHLQPAET